MKEPDDKAPLDLNEVQAVNNLDTARMSLRWALERLHALEKLKSESDGELERERSLRKKAETELQRLQSLLSHQPEDPHQRRLYYEKIENFVLLALAGKLDVAPLAARELEANKLKEAAQLKLEQLREKENWLLRQEQERAAAQARLEDHIAARQKELDRKIDTYRDELDEWVKGRLQNAERQIKQRYDVLSAASEQERAILLEEIKDCRRKSDEQLRQILELEKRLAEAQEAAYRASEALALERAHRGRIEDRSAALGMESLIRLGELQESDPTKKGTLLQQKREMEERLKAMTQELHQRQAELDRLNDAAEREKAALQERLGQEERKARELGDRLLGMAGELRAKQSELEGLQRESERQASALREDLERLKSSAEREKAALQERLGQEERKARELEERLRDMVGEVRAKQSEVESLRRESQGLESALREADERSARIEALERRLEEAPRAGKSEEPASGVIELQKRVEELEKALAARGPEPLPERAAEAENAVTEIQGAFGAVDSADPAAKEPPRAEVTEILLPPEGAAAVPDPVAAETREDAGRRPGAETGRASPSHQAYGRGIRAMKNLIERLRAGSSVEAYAELRRIVEDFLELLRGGDQELMALAARSMPGDYLSAHSVNVAVLALKVGLEVQARSKAEEIRNGGAEWLVSLGIASLLHDVGMVKWQDLAREPRKLTPEEQDEIRLHASESAKLLERVLDVPPTAKASLDAIVGQVHERLDEDASQASTRRMAEIPPAPQLISLCGIYEAMTHYRPWREPNLAHDTINFLLKRQRHRFDKDILKWFISSLSFYPPGSFVQLSNGQVGRVVRVRADAPASPVVEVWMRRDGTRQDPPGLSDVDEDKTLWIEAAIDESKLETEDKELLQHLRANRWWQEG